MSKHLRIVVVAETRKAAVYVDDAEQPITCSLKKEGNGTYSVVLKNKVEWPQSFINVGKVEEDFVIEKDIDDVKTNKPATSENKTTKAANPVKVLQAAYEVLKESKKCSEKELEALGKIFRRVVNAVQIDEIEKQIAALEEQRKQLLSK